MDSIKEAKTKVIHSSNESDEITNISPIDFCEFHYPEMMGEFKKILDEMYDIFARKQMNYGPDNISVGTQLESNQDIKLALSGLWFRKNDKINRLKQLVIFGQPDTVGESVEDTYQDLAVYGVISQIVQRKKWGK